MDMEFNVAQLMKEPVGAKRSYAFGMPELRLSEPLEGDPGLLVAHDLAGQVTLTRLRGQVRAVGTVTASVELECSRCLEPFRTEVSSPFDELFRQTIDVTSGAPVAVEKDGPDEDDEFAIDQNHILDLTEPMRQTLLVALPMRPLHSEDCKGLCPTCGANLNVTQCDCPTEVTDPRFAALSQLLAGVDTQDDPATP